MVRLGKTARGALGTRGPPAAGHGPVSRQQEVAPEAGQPGCAVAGPRAEPALPAGRAPRQTRPHSRGQSGAQSLAEPRAPTSRPDGKPEPLRAGNGADSVRAARALNAACLQPALAPSTAPKRHGPRCSWPRALCCHPWGRPWCRGLHPPSAGNTPRRLRGGGAGAGAETPRLGGSL